MEKHWVEMTAEKWELWMVERMAKMMAASMGSTSVKWLGEMMET